MILLHDEDRLDEALRLPLILSGWTWNSEKIERA